MGGKASVDYDVLELGESISMGGLLLLVCYGELVDPTGSHRLSIDQTFLLKDIDEPNVRYVL